MQYKAAVALASLYKAGKLDERGKMFILAHRSAIFQNHTDISNPELFRRIHVDYPAIEFPL